MGKQRMSAVDIAAEVACLRQLIGFRVANVYDLNPKTYVVKLSQSSGVSGTEDGQKRALLLESGIRFHTTRYTREKSDTPSGFTLKIRKHIRTRRLEDVQQRGIDRVVDFQFGVGESAHHLLLELYASGNVILTDCNYNVLTLLRSHRDDNKGMAIMSQHPYPLHMLRDFERTKPGVLSAVVEPPLGASGETPGETATRTVTELAGSITLEDPQAADSREPEGEHGSTDQGVKRDGTAGENPLTKKASKKGKKGKGPHGAPKQGKAKEGLPSLKSLLGQAVGYGAPICEHLLLQAGLSPGLPLAQQPGAGACTWSPEAVVAAIEMSISGFEDWLQQLKDGSTVPEGYIFCHSRGKVGSATQDEAVESAPAPGAGREGQASAPGGMALPAEQAFEEIQPGKGLQPVNDSSRTVCESQTDRTISSISGPEQGQVVGQGATGRPAAMAEASADEAIQAEQSSRVYDEFWPLRLLQLDAVTKEESGAELLRFSTFDDALDEYFSRAEGQRAAQQRQAAEQQALARLDKIRADQHKRAQVLEKEVEISRRKAQLIELNHEDVTAAIQAVSEELASGMDWQRLWQLIKEEQRSGNPVAGLIHSLHLERGRIALLLSGDLDSMDEEERTAPAEIVSNAAECILGERGHMVVESTAALYLVERARNMEVEVDISLSAFANARMWFDAKKKQEEKMEKTVAAHGTAFKAAERKTLQQLAQTKTSATVSFVRKVHWFEKFRWFVSSENYLVISGRDAQQNELLVKRYLKKGDIYVHADIHGAASTIVKNTDPVGARPIPPLTLNQAGSFTMCLSQAWDAKIVTSAWWVHHDQVSKSAPTGEYLTLGSFMIRGKKNFLPPVPLVLGFGFLFRLDQSSLAGHLHERRVRGAPGEEDEPDGAPASSMVPSSPPAEDGDSEIDDRAGELGDKTGGTSENAEEEIEVVGNNSPGHSVLLEDTANGSDVADSVLDSALAIAAPAAAWPHVHTLPGPDHTENVRANLGGSETALLEQMRPGPDDTARKSGFSKAARRQLKKEKKGALAPGAATQADAMQDNSGGQQDSGQADARETVCEEGPGGAGPAGEHTESNGLREPAIKQGLQSGPGAQQGAPGTDGVLEGAREQGLKQKGGKKGPKGADLYPTQQAGLQGVRGKKGKATKLKKYAAQDEEERELRMALLASSGKKERGKEDQEKPQPGQTLGSAKGKGEAMLCYKCKGPGHLARDCPTSAAEGASLGAHGIQAEEGELPTRSTDDAAEVEALPSAEGAAELSEAEREQINEVDELTGQPAPGDILLYAVPMCGPLSAMQNYKYRVKLTPGHMKKGKAVKLALDMFVRGADASDREKELIKAAGLPELVACMMGNVKVTAPGLLKVVQQGKASKKGAAWRGHKSK